MRFTGRVALGLTGLGLLAALGGLAGVSRLEETDSFCVACHTAPEEEYHRRAVVALGEGSGHDLASAHYALAEISFRCIDCHRGDGGLAHRAQTLALGARDSLIFLTGRADPTLEKGASAAPALTTAACAQCHAAAMLVVGFENHFHNKLPEAYAAWQAGGTLTAPPDFPEADTTRLEPYTTTVLCEDCHRAHVSVEGGALVRYLDLHRAVYPACVQCHQEVEQGPLELVSP